MSGSLLSGDSASPSAPPPLLEPPPRINRIFLKVFEQRERIKMDQLSLSQMCPVSPVLRNPPPLLPNLAGSSLGSSPGKPSLSLLRCHSTNGPGSHWSTPTITPQAEDCLYSQDSFCSCPLYAEFLALSVSFPSAFSFFFLKYLFI